MLSPEIGARGIQLSTRFLATKECNASQAYKDKHVYNTDPIIVMRSPVGMPGRAIENDFMRRVEAGEEIDLGTCVNCLRVCEHRESKIKKKLSSFCIIRALYNVHEGDVENGILFTGSNGNRLKKDRENGILTAKQVMHELKRNPNADK
jgi:NAD(P)H-dependent flavin oxidoreductase YrpB (nitropropane dioxygenase family)